MLTVVKKRLEEKFEEFMSTVRIEEVTDRNLDEKVQEFLKDRPVKESGEQGVEIIFSPPEDDIYTVEGGRTPYDLLISGKVRGTSFKIFLNNKVGNLHSSARNDTTTYNNLLRLYAGITTQRATKVVVDKEIILRRVEGKEVVSYGIFVVDKNRREFNFFLLEEVAENFYVNPRNSMFQVRYCPSLRSRPLGYYDFVLKLIDASTEALSKAINKAKTEILTLEALRGIITEVKINGG